MIGDAAIEGRSIRVGDHLTNYYDLGEGDPLVLLHGSGPGVSAMSNWSGVIGALAQRHRVIAPDLLGFGQTDLAVDGKYNPKIWGLHFRGFLDALGLERVSLVGNSFGGGVALGLALRKPETVKRLALMGAPAGEFAMTPGLRATYEYEPSLENLRTVLAHFPYDPELITDELLQQRFGPSARPGAQEVLRQLYPKPSSDGSATMMHTMPEDKLGEITAPTLVMHGREDRVIPFECALRLHRNIPNSELHSFGRCGHWVQAEHPEAFVGLVLDFLARG